MKYLRLAPFIATLTVAVMPLAAKAEGIPGFVAIPYRIINNRYIVSATLNGKPLNLMIDSGASRTFIDRDAFNSAIPKTEQVVPAGIPAKVNSNGELLPVFLAKHLRFGGIEFADSPVAIADFSRHNLGARHASAAIARQGFESVVIDGLIGMDILRSYNGIINTTRQVLYLNPDRSKRGGLLGDHMSVYGYKRVNLVWNRGLKVPCTLQGKPGSLIVDTGAWMTTLDYNYVRNAGVSVRPTALGPRGLMIGGHGKTAVFVARPTEFKLGDFVVRATDIACQGLEYGLMGFFGPELMERSNAIIDFGNLTMYLK